MRLDIPAVIVAMVATVAADRMEVLTSCSLTNCNSGNAFFYTDFGTYRVNANEACRGTSVPGMVEFCVDWGRRRAHFRFSGQSDKRCMVQDSETAYGCHGSTCWKTNWREIACNWRLIPNPGEQLATESATTLATTVKTSGN